MDTRNVNSTRARARGQVNTTLVAIIAVMALLALGAWFLIIKPHQEAVQSDVAGHPALPAAAGTAAAPPPPANVAAMDANQLLTEARKAMNERRYLAPVGNNAYEFYLRVLEKQPGNRIAADALRETFPFAATSAEQAINSRSFDEAQRQIDLLAKADPANFTLTILRSKLDAQRKMLDKQQQQVLDQQKAQLAATQKAAAEKAAADRLAEQQAQAAAAQQKAAAQRPAATPRTQTAAAEPATGAPAAGPATTTAAPTTDAVLLRAAPPVYPPNALRMRQAGWVVVSFTIDAEGRTTDVAVVSSQPRRIFDRAAIDAVNRYRFTPAMSNGVAVASKRQQKIEFNL